MSEVAERAARTWEVTLDELAVSGTNEVWFARRGDHHVVVKAGNREARRREAVALAAFSHSSARLLEHDALHGVLLVERVLLGDDLLPLARVDDDASTAIIGRLVRSLHSEQLPLDAGALPPLASLGEVFERSDDPRLPSALVRKAASLFAELTADAHGVVLHGDLHHFNVVRDGVGDSADRWRAIDPHGWVGDPTFDTAPMLANPRALTLAESPDVALLVSAAAAERRIAILAEATSFERDRIRAWAFTAAVIAELWMVEDHNLVHGAPLALAEALAPTV
ncbi:MAG: hypothetical protein F2842_08305 [Actinobacteria bacterium]|uniref:Unannotated protein n=1 Tax=freshwater metagenome TaxID=449393 RepID=A0A6J7KGD2_9ZZZZ|nr:hypothetical protein [Actinomycetota bacterium]